MMFIFNGLVCEVRLTHHHLFEGILVEAGGKLVFMPGERLPDMHNKREHEGGMYGRWAFPKEFRFVSMN